MSRVSLWRAYVSRRPRMQLCLVLLSLLLLGGLATTARAHPFSQSASVLVVSGREVRATLTINLARPPFDAGYRQEPRQSHLLSRAGRCHRAIFAAVGPHFAVHSSGGPIQTTVERYQLADETTVRLDLLYRFASDVTTIDITSTLDTITQPNHRHLMSVTSGRVTHEAILDSAGPARHSTPPAGAHTSERSEASCGSASSTSSPGTTIWRFWSACWSPRRASAR